jgi:hypothetical protein
MKIKVNFLQIMDARIVTENIKYNSFDDYQSKFMFSFYHHTTQQQKACIQIKRIYFRLNE